MMKEVIYLTMSLRKNKLNAKQIKKGAQASFLFNELFSKAL